MGALIVVFMFADRNFSCDYFPNARVLSDIRDKQMIIPAEVETQLNTAGLDTADISLMLLSGDIDFSQADRGWDTCKTYWITLKKQTDQPFSGLWQNCDSSATLLEVKLEK